MWWKIEEVPHQELEAWANAVGRFERAAKRDVAVRAAGAFVIYSSPDGALGYVAGREAPDGAYLVERWVRGKRGWTLYE
jgi:hypothetical protein